MRIAIEFDSLEEFQAHINLRNGGVTPADLVLPPAAEPTVTPRKRRTKAEMAADLAAAQTPQAPPAAEPPAVQDSEFDDTPEPNDEFDTPPAAVKVTKDDVRAALVGYQERLSLKNKDVEAVRGVVMALLKKVGGADKLGALAEDKFQAVIDAAKAAK